MKIKKCSFHFVVQKLACDHQHIQNCSISSISRRGYTEHHVCNLAGIYFKLKTGRTNARSKCQQKEKEVRPIRIYTTI